jgi:hypothetical protein
MKKDHTAFFVHCWMCTVDDCEVTYVASTSANIKNHLRTAHGIDCDGDKSVAKPRKTESNAALSTEPDLDRIKTTTAIWICESHRPFTSTESPSYVQMICAWQPLARQYLPVSGDTSKTWVQGLYKEQHKQVKEKLQNSARRICTSHDGWTSPNKHSILGVAATFVDEARCLRTAILALVQLKNHSGAAIADATMEVLSSYEISINDVDFMADNAKGNGRALREMYGNEDWMDHQVRCAAHIINLIVREILKPFEKLRKKAKQLKRATTDGPTKRRNQRTKQIDTEKTPDIMNDGSGIEGVGVGDGNNIDEEEEEEEDDLNIGPVAKVRALAAHLRRSPGNFKRWEEKFGTKIVIDGDTRWNSTLLMIRYILREEIHQGYNDFIVDITIAEKNEVEKKAVQEAQLNDCDWEMLQDLSTVLEMFRQDSERLQGTYHAPGTSDY